MARVSKEKMRIGDKDEFIILDFEVNVTVEGLFTTTLKKEDAKYIESLGVLLNRNRAGNPGFFSSKTKDGLISTIDETVKEAFSRELIEEKIVLQYSFRTTASFGLTLDGKVIPNLGWGEDGAIDKETHWLNGNVSSHASSPEAIGVLMYVKPSFKRTYKYRGGREKIEYSTLSPFGSTQAKKEQYYLRWLEGIASTAPPGNVALKEMDYTENRAKFFVETFKTMCKLAYSISQFDEPEKMEALADSQTGFKSLL